MNELANRLFIEYLRSWGLLLLQTISGNTQNSTDNGKEMSAFLGRPSDSYESIVPNLSEICIRNYEDPNK